MAFAIQREPPWNRCEICGRFISYDDFADGKATHVLVNPDAYGFEEKWSTFHNKCQEDTFDAALGPDKQNPENREG